MYYLSLVKRKRKRSSDEDGAADGAKRARVSETIEVSPAEQLGQRYPPSEKASLRQLRAEKVSKTSNPEKGSIKGVVWLTLCSSCYAVKSMDVSG